MLYQKCSVNCPVIPVKHTVGATHPVHRMKSGSGCICFITLIAEEVKKTNVLLLQTFIIYSTCYCPVCNHNCGNDFIWRILASALIVIWNQLLVLQRSGTVDESIYTTASLSFAHIPQMAALSHHYNLI